MDEKEAISILKTLQEGNNKLIEDVLDFGLIGEEEFANIIKDMPEAIDILLEVLLTHPNSFNARCPVANIIGHIKKDSSKVVPILIEAMYNEPRINSALSNIFNAIQRYGEEALDAAPAIIFYLDQLNDYNKVFAIDALGAMGKGAKDAVPKLLSLRESTKSSELRGSCSRALRKIAKRLDLQSVDQLIAEYDVEQEIKVVDETKELDKNLETNLMSSTITNLPNKDIMRKIEILEKKFDALTKRLTILESEISAKKTRPRFFSCK